MLVEGKQQCPNKTGKVAIVTSGAIQFNYPTPPPLLMTGFWSDQEIVSGLSSFRNEHLLFDTQRNNIIFVLYPSENIFIVLFTRKTAFNMPILMITLSLYLFRHLCILGICTLLKMTFGTTNPSHSFDPFRKSHLYRRGSGEGGYKGEWPRKNHDGLFC